MENMIEKIGLNAGLVWTTLNEMGKMDVKQLKRTTKIRTDRDLFAAVGWLAKEGKLNIEDEDGSLFFSLVY